MANNLGEEQKSFITCGRDGAKEVRLQTSIDSCAMAAVWSVEGYFPKSRAEQNSGRWRRSGGRNPSVERDGFHPWGWKCILLFWPSYGRDRRDVTKDSCEVVDGCHLSVACATPFQQKEYFNHKVISTKVEERFPRYLHSPFNFYHHPLYTDKSISRRTIYHETPIKSHPQQPMYISSEYMHEMWL